MIYKKIVLLLVIVFAFLVVINTVLADDNCCVPQYEDSDSGLSFTYYTFLNSPPQSSDDCDSLTQQSPNTPYLFDANCLQVGTGCCCNAYGNVALQGIDDTPSVYQYYCLEANYEFHGQNAVIGHTTCQSFCATGSTTNFNLSGHVIFEGNGSVLPGATVNLLNSGASTTTQNDGSYELSGISQGWNTFEISVAPIYVLNGDNITCNVTSSDLYFNEDRTENFSLTCVLNENICEPYWFAGEWGDCVPYGNIAVKFRDVTDLAGCNTSQGRPSSINTTACQGYVLNDCGNGVLDGTERCDVNETTQMFLLPNGIDNTTNTPACTDFFNETYSSGDLGCTETCNYDFSNCEGVCGPTCTHPNQCGVCDSCIDDPLCDTVCDTMKPNFLNAFGDAQRSLIRNVHDLYDVIDDPGFYGFTYGVKYYEGTNDVEIEWNYNESCVNTIMAYKVSICEESDVDSNFCKSNTEQDFVIEGYNQGQQNFLMSNVLEANTSYCYNVCAVGINKPTICAANETEKLVCFNTGDEYCMAPHEPGLNCEWETVNEDVYYVPTGCNYGSYAYTNLSLDSETCGDDFTCVETEFNPENELFGAACHASTSCDKCNGLFGLYGAYSLSTKIGTNNYLTPCDTLMYVHGNALPNDNSIIGLCYKDASLTPEPVYSECDVVDSCYNYKSQDACENDPCYKFTNSTTYNDCEWEYYNQEIGIGVCKTKTTELENCHACDIDAPTGNCNEELCSLYGDCYYKELANHGTDQTSYRPLADTDLSFESTDVTFYLDYISPHARPGDVFPTCMHERELSCYLYDNENDCTNGQEMIMHTIYHPDLHDLIHPNTTILYGTNNITQPSGDYFGFGVCAWNNNISSEQNGCHKNADAAYGLNRPIPGKQDDCVDFDLDNNENYQKCLQDITPPITELVLRPPVEQDQYVREDGQGHLPVYGQYEIAELEYGVTDDKWGPSDIDTIVSFVSLENCNSNCLPETFNGDVNSAESCYANACELYPQHEFEDFLNPTLNERFITNGEHELLYYSIDAARNMEIVHYERIYLDIDGPNILNFQKDIISFKLAEDIYASNLTINFSTSEPALCNGTLYIQRADGTNRTHPNGDFVIANQTSFGTFYRELPDGDYEFRISCKDDYNNVRQANETFRIEGDASIANPWPRGQVYRDVDEVILSLQTPNNATCKLSFMDNSSYYNSDIVFESTGELNHTHRFYPNEVNGNLSGIFIYYTSCLFQNGSITEQVPSDVISFTMDRLAPETSISVMNSDSGNYEPYDYVHAGYAKEKEFKLTCDDINEQIPIRTFGCDTISYCLGSALGNIEDFTVETNCASGEWTIVEGSEVTFVTQFFEHAGYFLYYYSTDKGPNQEEPIQFSNIKIKDTDFTAPPYFEILTN